MILEENQRQGWALRKKVVKWSKLQRRLKQRQVKSLLEEHRETELEMEESICKLEQGEILGEDEDWRSVEDLMNHMKDLEQKGDMMTESSSETTRSYVVKTDSFYMMACIVGEKKPFEVIFRIDEDLEVKGDKENFSEEEEFDWIQKKEYMDESVEAIIEIGDQDLILMKNEGILSQRGNLMNLINVIDEEQMQENIDEDDGARIDLEEGLKRDNKAKCIEEEGEADLSQDKEKTITELKKEDYAKDLAKGERTSDDWLITKEGMENCVKFPNSNPI